MENEMIERVARALRLVNATSEGMTFTELTEAMARAAIGAMREPTDEMADAVQEQQLSGISRETAVVWAKEDKWAGARQDLINDYQKFIDAALTPTASSLPAE